MTLDFDRRQFRLLLRLLSDLGNRRELTSQFGLDQHAVLMSSGFGLLLGGLLALVALADPAPRMFVMTALALSVFWLLPRLVSQAADAFMNPAEVAVLAHRPIRAGSYLAAKGVYVAWAALATTVPLNLVPALAGVSLTGTRWFFPLTHLLAVVAGSLYTTLVVCGLFGLLFRTLPISSVRTAALWLQLLAVTVVPLAPQLLNRLDVPLNLDHAAWSAIPITWFAATSLAGQPGRPALHVGPMAPAVLLSATCIVFGIRALTQHYMTRVSTMMRMKVRRAAPGVSLDGIAAFGNQATRAGTAFVRTLSFRDWQFRRMFLGGSIGIVMLFALGLGRSFATSPLQDPSAGRLGFLPWMLGLLMLNASVALAFTDRPSARWIFQVVPARGLRGVVRGMYWGLWQTLVAVPHTLLLLAGSVFWGVRDAVVFSTYSLSVSSLYLGAGLWLANGLPFTRPADPNRSRNLFGVMLLYLASGLGLGIFQRLVLFPHARFVPAATLLFAGAAWLAANISFRVLDERARQMLTNDEPSRRLFSSASRTP